MQNKPIDLSQARVLISNDDGINGPGLKVLEKAIRKVAREVWVVAPETEQSAASHSLTLREPLRLHEISKHRYCVSGTPTDSVFLGINKVMQGSPPDLVLSGINRGGNLGEDVIYSGTVAAAMEGAMFGIPAVALSQECDNDKPVHWKTSEDWLIPVLQKLLAIQWPGDVVMNVNFPNVISKSVTGIEATAQGHRKIATEFTSGVDPRGQAYYWVGSQRDQDETLDGTDLEAVTRGVISVTPLSLDLTHASTLKSLKQNL